MHATNIVLVASLVILFAAVAGLSSAILFLGNRLANATAKILESRKTGSLNSGLEIALHTLERLKQNTDQFTAARIK